MTWRRWKTGAGDDIVISGDPDWGDAAIAGGEAIYSPVTDTGDALTKTLTVTLSAGSFQIAIRGQGTAFEMLDATPDWEDYGAPIDKAWRYIQVRLSGAPEDSGWLGVPEPPFGLNEHPGD